MTDRTTNPEDILEAMIDENGLKEVMDFMVCIAAKKAKHIPENGQDENQSNAWSKAA